MASNTISLDDGKKPALLLEQAETAIEIAKEVRQDAMSLVRASTPEECDAQITHRLYDAKVENHNNVNLATCLFRVCRHSCYQEGRQLERAMALLGACADSSRKFQHAYIHTSIAFSTSEGTTAAFAQTAPLRIAADSLAAVHKKLIRRLKRTEEE